MKIKKPLKDEYGGGDKSFVFKELVCYKNIANLDNFLTSEERQGVLIFIINRLRAQEGIYCFIYVYKLLFSFLAYISLYMTQLMLTSIRRCCGPT